ncbi:MAG: hypothetical protein KUG73_05105, partial [Pseudomonadales bacterium]|nr:hypothetical protein [Pseudomonadales bacterium]
MSAASASANTYSFMVNRTVAGGKLHQSLTSLAGMSVSKGGIANFCDRFAHVLGYFAALDAALMAEEAYNSARYETATKELLNSASLVALTLGSQLLARGGIVMVAGFIPGVGVTLFVAGVLVQVAVVTWDFWMDQLKSSIQIRYSKAYRVLQGSPNLSEYEGKSHWQRVAYPGLQRPMELLMENDEYIGPWGIWDTLSWHAVIPLYLQQRDNQSSKTEQIEAVTEYVDLDKERVRELIQYYESSETLQSEKPMEKLPNGIYLKEM